MTLRRRILIGLLIAVAAVLLAKWLIGNSTVSLLEPRGEIAAQERTVIAQTLGIMLVVAIPMLIAVFVVAWHFRADRPQKVRYEPNRTARGAGELILWILPTLVVAILWMITWKSSHQLDPFMPLGSSKPPLEVQVVALPWKWLFIYPAQGIATVNQLEFPVGTPVHFDLTADGPMSSFWIPQLGSQMYAMSAMQTQLNLKADAPGEYAGRDTEINGPGYADMTFPARAVPMADFETWVAQVKQSSDVLDTAAYQKLAMPSEDQPAAVYASVEAGLFNTIVLKDMLPSSATATKPVMPNMRMFGEDPEDRGAQQMPGM